MTLPRKSHKQKKGKKPNEPVKAWAVLRPSGVMYAVLFNHSNALMERECGGPGFVVVPVEIRRSLP